MGDKCNPKMRCSEEEKYEERESVCGCGCLFQCQPYYQQSVRKKGEDKHADWYWTRVKDCPKHKVGGC